MRGETADTGPPLQKVQFIECYLEPFGDQSSLAELAAHWGFASRLADDATRVAESKGDVVALVHLGRLAPQFYAALERLREHRHVSEVQFRMLAKELDVRTRRSWLAVRAREPARSEPYAGIAVLAVRAGDYRQAVATLLEGLAACGDRPELLDLLTRLATATGNANAALSITWTAARRIRPIRRSGVSRRQRHSRQASVKSTVCVPKGTCERTETHVGLSDSGSRVVRKRRARKALELLESFGESVVRGDPRLVRLAVRALSRPGTS